MTYTPPEIRDLGTVAAQTLGSSRSMTTTVTKANNSTQDKFDSNPITQGLYGYGSPCTVQPGSLNCS